jgi:DNA mismatch repair protein MutS
MLISIYKGFYDELIFNEKRIIMAEKKLLIDTYFELLKEYTAKYGTNTVMFMQVGSFFEIYGIRNENQNIGHASVMADVLNIQLTKKNKGKRECNRSNPELCGIPLTALDRYLRILAKEDKYTIVIYEQVTEPPNVTREVTRVISPGIDIDNHSSQEEASHLVSIYIEDVSSAQESPKYVVGCSAIDVSTASSVVYENHSKKEDTEYPLDEALKFLKTYTPKEIIIQTENVTLSEDDIISHLEIRALHHIRTKEDLKFFSKAQKISYQQKVLEGCFLNDVDTQLSAIEYLDLELKPFGLLSLIFLLQFTYEHNESLLEKFNKPKVLDDVTTLQLTNNSIAQLNLINFNSQNRHKYSSLFEVINKTSTAMGKRLLKERLLNPIVDVNTLKLSYNMIEEMIPIYKDVESLLLKVNDVERKHRLIVLKKLNPAEFFQLDSAYSLIEEIYHLLKDKDYLNLDNFNISDSDVYSFSEYRKVYNKTFNIEEMQAYNIDDMNASIFNRGVFPDIDTYFNNVENKKESLNEFVHKINKEVNKLGIKSLKSFYLKFSENEGYYLSITPNNYKIISKEIINNQSYDELFHFMESSSLKKLKNEYKIFPKLFEDTSSEIIRIELNLRRLVRVEYENFLEKLSSNIMLLNKIALSVMEIDIVKSNARVAIENAYRKPIIEEYQNDSPYINAKNLRNALIEKIDDRYEYVPNNVKLGYENEDGILLYGVNASGKSSYMRSIGLSVIMAQSGMFVPAESFYYYPFKSIYTRITGEDNLFKKQSSFAVEMHELRNIIKRADNYSLILGDEISKGTESNSAMGIVGASIISLADRKAKFTFATHLHHLAYMDRINNLENVKPYHIKVHWDEVKEELIYDRKLSEGPGEAIYGLEVAKSMGLDKDFLDLANDIRVEYMDDRAITKEHLLLSNKDNSSHYNSDVHKDKCYFCDASAEDIHHIEHQEYADDNGMLLNKHKNHLSNLLPVCKKHHNEIHDGKIVIYGFAHSSKGKILKYEKK